MMRTPLHEVHLASGAKLAPFAGYEMPIQYSGIIAESEAVRSGVGLFDVSHMARLTLTGPGVFDYLQWVTSNDIAKLADGTGQYSLLPNAEGGVIDDIIVYRESQQKFHMVVNASNHVKDLAWLKLNLRPGVEIEDVTEQTAMIAVQGPGAVERVASLANDPEALRGAPAFGTSTQAIAGITTFAARSGYTGEDGFELICPADRAIDLWKALDATPCGLGSRDVLRVEAGLPLYGHELDDELSPIAAGLGWVIGKEKDFIGAGPIRAAQLEGTPQKLRGIKLTQRRLPTPGMAVVHQGQKIGEVTSGVVSPYVGVGIAFAFVDSPIPLGAEVALDMRGKEEPATLVDKRFFRRAK